MGACNLSIFHPSILGIKRPSQVYLEGHLGAHLQSRLLGDKDVQEALQTRLDREGKWTRKSSTTIQCEEIFQELELDQFLPRLEEDPNYIHTIRVEMPRYKKDANKKVQDTVLEKAQEQS